MSWQDPQCTANGFFASYSKAGLLIDRVLYTTDLSCLSVSSVKVECAEELDFLNTTSTGSASSPTYGTASGAKPNGTETVPAWLAWATSISRETSEVSDKIADQAPSLPSGWSATFSDARDSAEQYLRQYLPGRRVRRRRLALESPRVLRRAPADQITSYSYEGESRFCFRFPFLKLSISKSADIDDDGYVIVHGGSAPTTLSSDSASGLDGVASSALLTVGICADRVFPDPIASKAPSTTSASAKASASTSATSVSDKSSASTSAPAATASAVAKSDDEDEMNEVGLTVQQRWDKLGTAAHIGI